MCMCMRMRVRNLKPLYCRDAATMTAKREEPSTMTVKKMRVMRMRMMRMRVMVTMMTDMSMHGLGLILKANVQFDHTTDWKVVIRFILTTEADVFSRDRDRWCVMTIGPLCCSVYVMSITSRRSSLH